MFTRRTLHFLTLLTVQATALPLDEGKLILKDLPLENTWNLTRRMAIYPVSDLVNIFIKQTTAKCANHLFIIQTVQARGDKSPPVSYLLRYTSWSYTSWAIAASNGPGSGCICYLNDCELIIFISVTTIPGSEFICYFHDCDLINKQYEWGNNSEVSYMVCAWLWSYKFHRSWLTKWTRV
jgi:hypothetical protein